MDLKDNISVRRRAASLTQEDVASKLGVSRQTVGKWESGRATPELEKLINLCDLLGCSLDELVGRSEPDIASIEMAESLAVDVSTAASETNVTDAPNIELMDGTPTESPSTASRFAALLAAGIWFIAAAIGLLSLLLGPSSVDNIEVRRIVPCVIVLSACIGVILIVTAKAYYQRNMWTGTTSVASARRCRMVAALLLAVIATVIWLLISFTSGMRSTAFICLEIFALAAWPVVFAAVFTIDSRKKIAL